MRQLSLGPGLVTVIIVIAVGVGGARSNCGRLQIVEIDFALLNQSTLRIAIALQFEQIKLRTTSPNLRSSPNKVMPRTSFTRKIVEE